MNFRTPAAASPSVPSMRNGSPTTMRAAPDAATRARISASTWRRERRTMTPAAWAMTPPASDTATPTRFSPTSSAKILTRISSPP